MAMRTPRSSLPNGAATPTEPSTHTRSHKGASAPLSLGSGVYWSRPNLHKPTMPSPSFSDPAIDAFVSDLIEQAQRHGVALKLPSTPSLLYPGAADSHVSGYFVAHPTPTLAVATGKPAQEWLEILAHESSHLDQWTDNDPSWLGNIMADGREAVDWLDSWSSGAPELTDEQLADVVARAKAVEMDCERRTLLKISKWGLPIDSSAYAQRANAYVHFYEVVAQTGRWNEPGLAPYQVEGVWAHAPKVLANEAPEELKAAYARHYGPRSLRLLKP